MTSSGLRWLLEEEWPPCLVFVRGVSEDQVFRAFGADPDHAVPRRLGEPLDAAEAIPGPALWVVRAGEWVVAIEDGEPPQGVRPEVLRRVSSGGEAVALHADIGKLNHEFGYAADGDVIATLTTSVPPHWSGSDPGRFGPLARELGLTEDTEPPDELTELEAMLSLAERAFGLSLARADLEGPLPCARILPVLADSPRRSPAGQIQRTGDPVIDLLMSRADPRTLAAVVAVRMRRLMAATGLDAHPELAAAAEAALAGRPRKPDDGGPAGKVLRRIARDQSQAEQYLANLPNLSPLLLPMPEAELRQRVRQGEVATLLRFLLDGEHPGQLLASELHRQRIWDAKGWQEPLIWRAQAIADFNGVEVPAAELRAAEEAWLADPEPVRGRWGLIAPEPVRAHVSALIAAGMEPGRIAELSGTSTNLIDLLLRGLLKSVMVKDARHLLTIRAPR
jgi:hypothetical protein